MQNIYAHNYGCFVILAQQQKPQYFNECGGSLELDADATYGILTNPDYPTEANRESRYPNNADCLWTLEGDEATLVQASGSLSNF